VINNDWSLFVQGMWVHFASERPSGSTWASIPPLSPLFPGQSGEVAAADLNAKFHLAARLINYFSIAAAPHTHAAGPGGVDFNLLLPPF